MTMLNTLSLITRRKPSGGDAPINGCCFKVIEDCESDYGSKMTIPAGSVVVADFAGDFGMYGVTEIDGVLHKVKVPLEELHKIHFGEFEARNI